jgi:S1-C subfamily serine protease
LPRTSRLAIAAFITGVAGIPFFGVLTGLVAILLGSLAIGALRDTGRKGNGLAVAGILLGLLDVVGWIVFLGYFYVQHGQNLQFERFQPDLGALQNLPPAINRAMPANILIETRDGPLGKPTGLGSGIIMKITGGEAIILTNRHVVDIEFALNPQAPLGDKAEKISLDVTLVDQSVQPGKVIWMAPGGIDFALVRIHGVTAEARAALWKIDRGSRVGDQVFAIGNPHGLGWTHTQGAISQFRIQDLGEKRLRVIQTQTALNPGNSGGGLYDQEGYLLGVNTWAKDKQVAEGLNFAIALDALKTVSPPGLNLQAGSEGQDKP